MSGCIDQDPGTWDRITGMTSEIKFAFNGASDGFNANGSKDGPKDTSSNTDIDLDNILYVTEDASVEDPPTLNISEANSSFPTFDQEQKISHGLGIKMDNFRERLQSARSNQSVKPANPICINSSFNNSATEPLRIFDFSSTFDDDFRLNVVDMDDGDDEDLMSGLATFEPERQSYFRVSTTERYNKPLPPLAMGDQILPDGLRLSLSNIMSRESELNTQSEINNEKLRPITVEKMSKDFTDYHQFNSKNISFDDLKSERYIPPSNTPVTASFRRYDADYLNKKLLSRRPSPRTDKSTTQPRLRLITSGSSVEGGSFDRKHSSNRSQRVLSEEEVAALKARRVKERTIDHNDFQGFEEEDFQKMFMMDESDSKSAVIEEVPGVVPDVVEKSEDLHINSKIALAAPKQTNQSKKTYQFISSAVSSSTADGSYTGVSLLEMVANHLDKDFTAVSAYVAHKDITDLQNKDEWIKSLNSAFSLDEDLSGELKRFSEFDVRSFEQTASCFEKSSSSKSRPESFKIKDNEENEPQAPPKSAISLFSFTNEKMADLFQKFSARINIVANEDNQETVVAPLAKDFDQQNDFKKEVDEQIKSVLDTGLSNNEELSSPGTVTAKMFNRNPLFESNFSDETSSFVVEPMPIKSIFIENISCTTSIKEEDFKSRSTRTTESNPTETAYSETCKDENEWALNNKFIGKPKNSINKRRKTIKKIFFSALSKDSVDDSENSKESSTSNLSWSKSILRRKSSESSTEDKKIKKSNFNMDSGESLKGYAAEYASENDLSLKRVVSKDAEATRKIMDAESKNIIPSLPHPSVLSADTIDSRLADGDDDDDDDDDDTLELSGKSLSEYVPTPIPLPKRQKSFFFPSKGRINISRNKTYAHERNVKREYSIRFAPTPEYVSNKNKGFKPTGISLRSFLGDGEKHRKHRKHKHTSTSLFKMFMR